MFLLQLRGLKRLLDKNPWLAPWMLIIYQRQKKINERAWSDGVMMLSQGLTDLNGRGMSYCCLLITVVLTCDFMIH